LSGIIAGVCLSTLLALGGGCDQGGTSTTSGGGAATQGSGGGGPSTASSERPRVAYITNGIDPFWDTAVAGARVGAKEFNVELEVHKPAKGVPDQNRIVEGLIAKGVQGIAISAIDAANQADLINSACASAKVITHDADAPETKRLCFIGVNNYKAGRAVGRLVKEAVPGGGKVMIFVGRLEQLNAQQRRQGVIDELLDRPEQNLAGMKFDPQSGVQQGSKYSVIDTRTDNFNYDRAKGNAEDAITSTPDLACMVGLFAYNPPQCLEAVRGAGKIGKIQIIGFDEQEPTLQGIIDGEVYGTVSQQPFRYGYNSMKILSGLIKGDNSVMPPNGHLELDGVVVKKDNVDTFWKELKEQQAQGKAE
jgi:ribose transport system substrate-binding protein